jgi:hypothetical protein
MLAALRRDKLIFTPWFLLSPVLIRAATDGGFAYYDAAGMTEEVWIWDVLYNTIYYIIKPTIILALQVLYLQRKESKKKIWLEENC